MKYARLLSAISCLFFSIKAEAKSPNVLLLLTDNQSYHELSCHDHKVVKTPHIDTLASQSIDFTNFHAPNYCSPSRALLMTGRYPLRYGVHNTIGGVSILHKKEKTLANYLQASGYKTAIFGKWHLGLSYPYAPRYRGFEECFIHGGGGIGQMEDAYGNNHIDARYWHNGKLVNSKGYSSDVLFDKAGEFIKSHVKAKPDQPFFCFVSTPATHSPHQPHPAYLQRLKERGITSGTAGLWSMIENIDDCVGRILKTIDDLKLRDNTIVIFATDQGMRSRGASKTSVKHPPSLAADDRTHVFYMLRFPPVTKQPGSSGVLTGMVDVFPTILDLCGVNLPANIDGRSQRPILAGATTWEDDRIIIFQCPRSRTRKKWIKANLKSQQFRMTSEDKLLTATRDAENVTAKHPEMHQRMVATYNAFWDSLAPEAELICRHEVGENPTRLCAMDWYKGKSPWNKNSFKNTKQQGTWALEVTKPGKYRFEIRRFPREAGKAIEAIKAELKVGDLKKEVKLTELDQAAIFELNLTSGNYDLDALFTHHNGNKWGPNFAYISEVK